MRQLNENYSNSNSVAVLKGFDNDVVDFILKDYEFTNK